MARLVRRRRWLWIAVGVAVVAQALGYFGRELFAALILFSMLFVVFMSLAAVLKALHFAWSALLERAQTADTGKAPAFSKTLFHHPRS